MKVFFKTSLCIYDLLISIPANNVKLQTGGN